MNESETRVELIDPALQAAGWGVVEGSRSASFNVKQQAFLDFVLSHYVAEGVRDNSIADAIADLGRPDEIGEMFSGFQQYLYQVGA